MYCVDTILCKKWKKFFNTKTDALDLKPRLNPQGSTPRPPRAVIYQPFRSSENRTAIKLELPKWNKSAFKVALSA